MRLTSIVIAVVLIGLSVLVLSAPTVAGKWFLQLVAILPLMVGVMDLYATITAPSLRFRPSSYVTGILAIAIAALLFASPSLVVSGIIVFLLLFLALDGVFKIGQGLLAYDSSSKRLVPIVNGATSLLLALVGWILWRVVSLEIAVGVAVGGYTIAAGWRMLLSPQGKPDEPAAAAAVDTHPDPKMNLGSHEIFTAAIANISASSKIVRQTELRWLAVVALILFATHLTRMNSLATWLGVVSPLIALAGDGIMAVLLGGFLILPIRLGWRILSRWLERKVWKLRLSGQDADLQPVLRRVTTIWADGRLTFAIRLRNARDSLLSAAGLALRLGLPLAALFVAINSIWGFNWFFNTESWASGLYHKVTELRVDPWRQAMAEAVAKSYGIGSEELFRIDPAGIHDQDFSFIIVGDPGEGDGSQYALIDRYLDLQRQDQMKFLVISSDVIYPAGAMTDYEQNFFMPFKGFTKPIYAIPGNHDWFDALEGFNANFLEPRAAAVALTARITSDFGIVGTGAKRLGRLLDRAATLRELYGTDIAHQRGPFFEIQTEDFALIAVDTGIQRTVDESQLAWLEGALERSRGKFSVAILGHPRFAAGADTAALDEDFAGLYGMIEAAGVRVIIAGDTHAFEYYHEGGKPADGEPAVHYFVNGGGGAYMSVGGALAWPSSPATEEWAFYPSTAAVRAKLDAETPWWKRPFWLWIKRLGAWPLSVETLSAIFDFNSAPFFQSFMEVRVERSKKRVVFALQGTNGPVLWRELRIAEEGLGAAHQLDQPVEFIVPMGRHPKP